MLLQLVVIVLLAHLAVLSYSQVATPVFPTYNFSEFDQFYRIPLLKHTPTLPELIKRGSIGYHHDACFMGTNQAAHGTNRVIENFSNVTELREDPYFLWGKTYWIHDYLHVGHVHYDIVMMQLLEVEKIDRIVMQRAVCHGILCAGIGTMESFYKGYFAALFEAFGQPNIPVYLRWTGRQQTLDPMYFSAHTPDNFYKPTDPAMLKPLEVRGSQCFEKVFRRVDTHFGEINVLGPTAVQKFKAAAYALIKEPPLLTTYFDLDEPFRITFSYRGPQASRHIENLDEFIGQLKSTFPAPKYALRIFNNSDPHNDYKMQMRAVAEANVVITNHGAFEGNMIYMKNSRYSSCFLWLCILRSILLVLNEFSNIYFQYTCYFFYLVF